ncbi:MAG: O-methyltransferase, family 3 protein [Myxococcales bacterium]|nr:O-methyltransferase, family 3 protein [Myxococcales bacterium]
MSKVTPDPFFLSFRALVEEYKALATGECNEARATSSRVAAYIDAQLAMIEELKAREQAGRPVPHASEAVVLMTGLQGYTLLQRAPWLDADVRARLETLAGWPMYLERGPYRFTADFGTHHQLRWAKEYAAIAHRPSLRAVEIGVFEGMTSTWLLDNVLTDPTSRLICVDAFEPPRNVDNYAFARRANAPTPEQLFDANIAASSGASKVQKIAAYSGVALRTLPVDTFDLVYVDGSHLAPDVLEDAILVWRMLKVGALVTFDDYGWELPVDPLERPQPALDAFMTIFAGKFELVHKSWQLTLRKLRA